MKPVAPLCLLLAALAATAGCRALPEPVCQSQLLVPVVAATGPRRVAAGATATYTLDVKLGNSCGALSTPVVSPGDSLARPRVVQVGVQGLYTGCTCTADTVSLTRLSYQFQPTRPGTYLVQFLTRRNAFLTDTLTVY